MPEKPMLEAVERWAEQGARGVKISPSNMRVQGDDSRLLPLFDYCQSRGLLVLCASGNPRRSQDNAWLHLPPFITPLKRLPRLRIIFAHMGYFPHMRDRGADELLATMGRYPDVCTDLSLLLEPIAAGESPERLAGLIRRIGADRVLFGTNSPFGNVQLAIEGLRKLPLTDSERELIAYRNYQRLVG